MSSLRDLLDAADLSGIAASTYYGPRNAHQLWWRGDQCWTYENNHDYHHQRFVWCVPTNCVCKLIFEVWGGGGGGGGACCCMGGANGHAGAYNKFTMCANDYGVDHLDCCCYALCAGSTTCRHPGNGGFDGCKSWVEGPNLDNFCACGGCHGYSCCFHAGHSAYGCQTRMLWQTGDPWNRWQSNCWETSTSSSRSCRECCCEEGKEYWGTIGSFNQADCFDCGNWCWMKWIVPTSAYQEGKFGTHHIVGRCSMATCGRIQTMWMEGNNGGLSSDCFRNGPPGMGGFSAEVHHGPCCCSGEGAAGLVKITIYCKE